MRSTDVWMGVGVVVMLAVARAVAADVTVSLVSDGQPGAAAAHGMKKIAAALGERKVAVQRAATVEAAKGNVLIVMGLAGAEGPAARVLKAAGVAAPTGVEALVIKRVRAGGKPAVLIAGSDDRGLMYAELEVARQIGWAKAGADALSEVREAAEKADVPERALSVYTMHRACFEARFHDEAYWAAYLDMLAENRFNTFVLIFGYENGGYFAPPYPYFVDVAGFGDVRVIGQTKDRQRKNLASLNRLIRMTRQRGLRFTLGIWDHIYRGGVQGPTEHAKKPTKGLVWGVTRENLVAYTKAALATFLRAVDRPDAIQFRMHGESGLRRGEMPAFWTNVYEVVQKHAPGVRFDARAKNFPDSLIDKAVEMGVPIRITTKYWMEQMGLPFHPTHIHPGNQRDRRHGYADLLRYPRRYKMHWRLWNGGTTRVLLWGDPQYVRRFAASTHVYDGEGFEVNEPLATKMQDHPHDQPPFDLLRPRYRYYQWEFQRYWHFFQVWGRLGYNPRTPPDVWRKEFERRFGQAAAHVERGLHLASRVLPRIVAYNYPYRMFPTTRGWAARQRMGDLPAYAKALPSDTQQFLSMDEAARNRLEGRTSPKIHPVQSSQWFDRTARAVLEQVDLAAKSIGKATSKELVSTLVDLRILAHLARYHSQRALAGLSYALFARNKDVNALEDAIRHEALAVKAWEGIVEAAGDVYTDDLMMGRRSAGLSGHWKDELAELKKGLADLRRRHAAMAPKERERPPAGIAPTDFDPPAVSHERIAAAPAEKPLTVTATVRDPSGVKWVRLRYRIMNQTKDYKTLAMKPAGKAGRYSATVPADDLPRQWDFMYFLEVMDTKGNGRIYPDLEKEMPYVVVRLRRGP